MLAIFPSGPFATNAYVLHCPTSKKAVVIDPAPGSAPQIIEYIEKHQLIPEKILLTHTHFDHIADTIELQKMYPLKIGVHALDAQNLTNPGSDGLPLLMAIEPAIPDFYFDEDEVLEVGDIKLQVIHTPGHSPGSVCFYARDYGLLFSGDTLFKGTIGNLSFPTARPNLMWPSLKKLAKLARDTKVYPGHGTSTTIADEPWLEDAEHYFN